MRTLVLNKGWMPIGHTTYLRALHLVHNDRAESLEYYNREVKTSNHYFFAPAVIRLRHYGGIPKRKVSYSRRAVLIRDNFICQYCGKSLANEKRTIDHVVPKCQGGKSTFTNTVASCFPCNNKKGRRTPKEAGLKLLRKPFKPSRNVFRFRPPNPVSDEWVEYIPQGMLGGNN